MTPNHVHQVASQVRQEVRGQMGRLGYAREEAHRAVRLALRRSREVFAYCRSLWDGDDPCD